MKRLSAAAAGLLFFAFALSGCVHRLPSDGWVTLFDGTSADPADLACASCG